MSNITINASTSLVQAVPPDIVLLSSLNYPGQIITVRDFSGQCSSSNVITISTTQNVQFLNGLSNSNVYQIKQPYGFLTFTNKASTIWAVVNSFAFQDQTIASISTLNSKFIFNSTIYSDVVSTTLAFPSVIGLNCNAPRFLLDANGILNVQQLYQDGRLFVADGNLSTVNSSTINLSGLLNLSNSSNVPSLRIQDTVLYGGTPPGSLAGSNQIFLTSNLINLDNTAFLTSNHQLGVNLSTTTQSLDVVGNAQADSFLLRSSIISIPATIVPPTTSSIEMVAYANNKWFLSEDSAEATNKVYFSDTDGYTWSTLTNVAGFSRNSIAYGNNRWVAGGTRSDSFGNALVYSLDGITWTPANANTFNVVNSVIFMSAHNVFIAAGNNINAGSGQSIAFSSDGISWTFFGPVGRFYNDLTLWITQSFVAVGESKVLDFYNNFTGSTWTTNEYGGSIVGSMSIKTVVKTAASDWLYIGGFTDGTSNATLRRSLNLATWDNLNTPFTTVNKIRLFSSIIIAVGQNSLTPQSNAAIATSSDGFTWTARPNPLIGLGRDVAHFNGQFIVGGATSSTSPITGGIVASSNNGVTWNQTVFANFFSSSRITVSSSFLFLNNINLTQQFTSNTTFNSTIDGLQSGSRSTVAGLGSLGYVSTFISTFSNIFTSTLRVAPGNSLSTIRIFGNLSIANTNVDVPDIQLPGLALRQRYSATNPTNYMQLYSDGLNINNTVWILNSFGATSSRVGIGINPPSFTLDVGGIANFRSNTIVSSLLVNTNTFNSAYAINANGAINATSFLQNGAAPIFPNPLSSVVMSTLFVNSTNGFAITNNASTLLGGLLSSVGGANFGGSITAADISRGGISLPQAYSTFTLSSLTLNTPNTSALTITGSTIINGLVSTTGNIQTSGTINAGSYLLNGNPFAPDNVSSINVSTIRSIVDPLVPITMTSFVNSTNPNTSNIWFAGVSNASGVVGRYSTDNGVNWLISAFPQIATNTSITAVAWNGRYFLAAASPPSLTNNSVTFFSSINGISWTSIPATGTYPRTKVNKIIWTGTQWIAGGQFTESSSVASNATIARSSDGGSWTGCTSGGFSLGPLQAGECFDIAFNGRILVAAGYHINPTNNPIKYSLDNGANWVGVNTGQANCLCVTTNGRIFTAGGYAGNAIYSFDGINWSNATGVPVGLNQGVYSMATNGRIFVCHAWDVFGSVNGYKFYYSYDGATWTATTQTLNTGYNATSISWNGSRFITGSLSNYTIHVSADGITWNTTSLASPTSGTNVPAIAFTSNVFPDFQIENIAFFGKNQWPTHLSTNTIHLAPSSLVIDSILRVGLDGRVGINCNAPQFSLDINGSFYASSITAGNITGFVTTTNLTSTVTGLGSSSYISTPTLTSSLTGLGTLGYISTSGLVLSLTSSITGLGTSGYISTGSLTSSIIGLGTSGYVSTASLTSTVASLTTNTNAANLIVSSITSRDTPTTPIEMNAFLDVTNQRSSNIWVAVGISGGNPVRYSTDGQNWLNTNITYGTNKEGYDVAWNGNYFLTSINNSGASGGIEFWSSINGSTWGSISVSGQRPDTAIQTIIWTGSQWIAGGGVSLSASSNSTIVRSVDGSTWVGATSGGFTSRCFSLATNGRRIVAVGQSATAAENIKYSDDNGVTWTNCTGATFTESGRGIATDGRNWIAVGIMSGGNCNAIIKYSADGISWSNVSTFGNALTGAALDVKYNGRFWVATGNNSDGNGSIMIYSIDGRVWNRGSAGSLSATGGKIAWSGSRWVCGTNDSSSGLRLRWSDDGVNWSNAATTNMFANQANGIAFSSNVVPDLQVENFSIYGKSQWPALASTNYMYVGRSTLNINNVVSMDSLNYRFDVLTQQRIIAQGSTSLTQYGNNGAPESLMLLSPCNAYQGAVASLYFGMNGTTNYPLARIVAREVQPIGVGASYQSELLFQTNNFPTNGTELATRMFINRDGRVGINTTSPSYTLDVNGTFRVETSQEIYPVMNGNTYMYLQSTGGRIRLGNWNSGTGGILTLNEAGGNVGINIVSPLETVDVNGVLRLRAGTCQNTPNVETANKTNTYIAFDHAGTNNDFALLRQIGGDNRIHIALDLHDDGNDGSFSIRRVASAGTGADTVATLFTINENAQIGIGTSTPNGNIQFPNENVLRRIVFWENANNDHQVVGIGKGVATMNFQNPVTTDDFVFQAGTSATTSSELFRIKGNARIGINCNAPNAQLHVNHASGNSHGILISMAQGQQDPMIRLSNASGNTGTVTFAIPQFSGNWNSGTASNDFVIRHEDLTRRIFINTGAGNIGACISNGSLAINTNVPQARLDVKGGPNQGVDFGAVFRGTAANSAAKATMTAVNEACSMWPMATPDNDTLLYFYYRKPNGENRYIAISATGSLFTGQHINRTNDSNISLQSLNSLVGLIVSSADEGYTNVNNKTNKVITGKDAIWITEALPYIKLTTKDKDKAVWGVLSHHQNDKYDTDGKPALDSDTEWKNSIDGGFRVNGLGEGAIWITNINGNLENGDYICSSVIPGYGRKQDDDLLHNYTVAKITMSCSFELNQNNYVCQEFTYQGKTYRKAYVGCTYHCS